MILAMGKSLCSSKSLCSKAISAEVKIIKLSPTLQVHTCGYLRVVRLISQVSFLQ